MKNLLQQSENSQYFTYQRRFAGIHSRTLRFSFRVPKKNIADFEKQIALLEERLDKFRKVISTTIPGASLATGKIMDIVEHAGLVKLKYVYNNAAPFKKGEALKLEEFKRSLKCISKLGGTGIALAVRPAKPTPPVEVILDKVVSVFFSENSYRWQGMDRKIISEFHKLHEAAKFLDKLINLVPPSKNQRGRPGKISPITITKQQIVRDIYTVFCEFNLEVSKTREAMFENVIQGSFTAIGEFIESPHNYVLEVLPKVKRQRA